MCNNRPARLEELDELVWSEVLGLLQDPVRLLECEVLVGDEQITIRHSSSPRRHQPPSSSPRLVNHHLIEKGH